MRKTSKDRRHQTSAATDNCPSIFCRGLSWLAVVLTMLGITGCQSGWNSPYSAIPIPKMAPTANPETGFYSTNSLHEGDVVDIIFQYATNYSTLQKIALDGTLNLSAVGPVKAAGKTVVELQQDVAKAYQSLAKDDVITVNLMMNSTAIIYVSGAVLKPGEVPLGRPLTAIEAVMAAGGFDNTRASLSDVKVLRLENGQQQAYRVNLKRVLDGRDKTPFYLKPFDIVYVPTKTFNY